jgi:aspartate carbamoyltransferase catalytic subunit
MSSLAWPDHLLDVADLPLPELERIMATSEEMAARIFAGDARLASLRGRRVTNLFFEPSTRTRVSFEIAARNLSADVVNVAAAASSVAKGESLVDTVRTLEALGADVLVVRHARSGAPYLAADHFGGHVINAGDGWHAHPTQALLDLFTLRRHLPGGQVRGRKIVILGDILHSRVARSNTWTLTTAGADLWLCGPPTLLRGFDAWASALAGERRLTVTPDIRAALRDADAVMALRLQRERQEGGLIPSLREYAARYALTAERLRDAAPEAIVLHPGPMNEGVEIDPDVATGGRSVITEQVGNGVAVRMAVLHLLAAGEPPWREREPAPAEREVDKVAPARG